MKPATQQGDPDSIVCRWCSVVRTVIRSDGEHVHRVCRTCDAPDNRVATWERNL